LASPSSSSSRTRRIGRRRLSRRRLLVSVALAAAALAAAGFWALRSVERLRPPIVLISIDTLRSDRLPAYGHRAGSTPAIDALARDAILFERAYSHYPLTLPSHASVFSGLLPPHHGVRDNVGYRFDGAAHPTLASLLGRAGYDSAAFVSAFVLRAATGIGHGFAHYDDAFAPRPGQSLDAVERSGAETTRRAISWLEGRTEKPFLLFLHLYEPHAPYLPPEPFAERLADPYDGEVAAADAAVGELLEALRRRGLYDEALIALFSDHGEALGDHGGQTHGVFLYREALQVPLLLKLPGARDGGRRIGPPVRLVDLFATVLASAGETASRSDGRDLLELVSAGAPPRPVYAETWYPRLHFGWSELASWIDGDHHYIEGPDPELFDLAADPPEHHNIASSERRRAAELRAALAAIDRSLSPPQAADAETRASLAALGYAAGPAQVAADGPLPDPKTQLHTVRLMEQAYSALGHGDLQGALEGFERLLAANPRMADIAASLAQTLQRLERHREADAAFERALALAGDPRPLLLAQATSLIALERFAEAEERIAAAGDLDPRATADARRRLAMALAAAGRGDEAVAALGAEPPLAAAEREDAHARALALHAAGRSGEAAQGLRRHLASDPTDARGHEIHALLAFDGGTPATAEAEARAALALDDRLPGAWAILGRALHDRGEREAAIAAWERAVALDPGQHESLFNLGVVAHALGRRDQARAALTRFVATAPPSRFARAILEARALLR
jgi:arylsulfatase A-like enzyme/Tfp pilus assembly protein PilF